MTEYQFFRVEDGVPLMINHEFVLDNPTELLIREKTTKEIFLRLKNNEWDIKNLNILDYLNIPSIPYCHDENHDVVYIVPFTNFGVHDYKFSFRDDRKTHEIFMTTDIECDSIARPIVFNNFEVFNRPTHLGDITATVKYYGIVFNIGTDKDLSTLSFTNSITGQRRIFLYESDAYKNGSLDFDVIQRATGVMKSTGGFDNRQSDLSITKICQKRYSYYTDSVLGFSLIFFEDREQKLLEIYKEICGMVGNSIYLTKNMKSDLELILLRWFTQKFNSSNLNLVCDLISLHGTVDNLINSCYDIKRKIANVSDRNLSLYT